MTQASAGVGTSMAQTVRSMLLRFWYEDSAATAAEYAILASLIAVAVIVTVAFIGQDLDAKFAALLALLQVMQQ